jgi:hypothetical protein
VIWALSTDIFSVDSSFKKPRAFLSEKRRKIFVFFNMHSSSGRVHFKHHVHFMDLLVAHVLSESKPLNLTIETQRHRVTPLGETPFGVGAGGLYLLRHFYREAR